jgi:hypothetical protein
VLLRLLFDALHIQRDPLLAKGEFTPSLVNTSANRAGSTCGLFGFSLPAGKHPRPRIPQACYWYPHASESRGLAPRIVRLFATHDSPYHQESRGLAPRIFRFLAGTPVWSEKPNDLRCKPAGFAGCGGFYVAKSRTICGASPQDSQGTADSM